MSLTSAWLMNTERRAWGDDLTSKGPVRRAGEQSLFYSTHIKVCGGWVWWQASNPNSGEAETGRFLVLTGQPARPHHYALGSVRDLCQNARWRGMGPFLASTHCSMHRNASWFTTLVHIHTNVERVGDSRWTLWERILLISNRQRKPCM